MKVQIMKVMLKYMFLNISGGLNKRRYMKMDLKFFYQDNICRNLMSDIKEVRKEVDKLSKDSEMERERFGDGETSMPSLSVGEMERERQRDGENTIPLLFGGEMERESLRDGEKGLSLFSGGEMEREKRRDGENGISLLSGGEMDREKRRDGENGISLLSGGEMERERRDGENGMIEGWDGEMEREKQSEGENGMTAGWGGEIGSERQRDREKDMVADIDGEIVREKQRDGDKGMMVASGGDIEDGELMEESETSDGELTITGEIEVMDIMELSKRLRMLEKCYDILENRVFKCENSILPIQNSRSSQKKITKEEMMDCMKRAVQSLGTEKYGVSKNQIKKYVGDTLGIQLGKSSYYSKKFSILLKKSINENLIVFDGCHGLYTVP